mmetsp:Transcript_791/g.2128  ORF Transcript_791/g.2128 Transcript_791/m.2128 type:complete len:204 (-) Transcript_791:128-739(-)
MVLDSKHHRSPHNPLRTLPRYRLDPKPTHLGVPDAACPVGERLPQKVVKLPGIFRSGCELDPRIHILDVLAEYHHVHPPRVLDRRRRPLEPPHGAEPCVEVQPLPDGYRQGGNALVRPARERAFQSHVVLPERIHRLPREPLAPLNVGLVPCENLLPLDLPVASVGQKDGRIQHSNARRPNVGPYPVSFDERNYGIVRNPQLA